MLINNINKPRRPALPKPTPPKIELPDEPEAPKYYSLAFPGHAM